MKTWHDDNGAQIQGGTTRRWHDEVARWGGAMRWRDEVARQGGCTTKRWHDNNKEDILLHNQVSFMTYSFLKKLTNSFYYFSPWYTPSATSGSPSRLVCPNSSSLFYFIYINIIFCHYTYIIIIICMLLCKNNRFSPTWVDWHRLMTGLNRNRLQPVQRSKKTSTNRLHEVRFDFFRTRGLA